MESGVRPYQVRRLAGHVDLNTTMEYYVGIRESVIARARQASRKNVSDVSVANLLQIPEKGRSGQGRVTIPLSQTPGDKDVANDRGDRT